MGVFVNIVHLIDCREFMKDKPDSYYDLAIVDPPYGIGNFLSNSSLINGKKGTRTKLNIRYKGHHTKWNKTIPTKGYFKELIRMAL